VTIKPITAHGFRGMNNLPGMPAKMLDDERRITPTMLLNADATDGGKVLRRDGYDLQVSLEGCHSLWAGSVMLGVANGVLYRIDGTTTTVLSTVGTWPLRYVELDNLVYMASLDWTGIYDLLTGEVRSWGVALPAAPSISLVAGDLPPGTYVLGYTRTENGQVSGNGPLLKITWEGAAQGIQLNNLPTDGQCWITHPNGQKLYLASLDGNVVTGQVPQGVPLPSFTVAPPPGLTDFCQGFGRIWGCVGKKLIYSDPFQYGWFRLANFKPFLEDLVMVAAVSEGIFVNSRESTWFLDGSDPAQMTLKRIGDGAVPGTLVFAQMPGAVVGGGYEISRRLSQLPSPVWMSQKGAVVGTHTGHLVHLTEQRLFINPRTKGASVCRIKEGIPRIIITMQGQKAKAEDEEITIICNNGELYWTILPVIGCGGFSSGGAGEISY